MVSPNRYLETKAVLINRKKAIKLEILELEEHIADHIMTLSKITDSIETSKRSLELEKLDTEKRLKIVRDKLQKL